jgi:hypothetical protein
MPWGIVNGQEQLQAVGRKANERKVANSGSSKVLKVSNYFLYVSMDYLIGVLDFFLILVYIHVTVSRDNFITPARAGALT